MSEDHGLRAPGKGKPWPVHHLMDFSYNEIITLWLTGQKGYTQKACRTFSEKFMADVLRPDVQSRKGDHEFHELTLPLPVLDRQLLETLRCLMRSARQSGIYGLRCKRHDGLETSELAAALAPTGCMTTTNTCILTKPNSKHGESSSLRSSPKPLG